MQTKTVRLKTRHFEMWLSLYTQSKLLHAVCGAAKEINQYKALRIKIYDRRMGLHPETVASTRVRGQISEISFPLGLLWGPPRTWLQGWCHAVEKRSA